MGRAAKTIERRAIRETAERLHPAAFVHVEPGQPVLIDDGHCSLLLFDDHGDGCYYTCDGERMGLVADRTQLDQILVTVAAAYRALDPAARALAMRHTAELARSPGAEVYRRAREHVSAQLGETSPGRSRWPG